VTLPVIQPASVPHGPLHLYQVHEGLTQNTFPGAERF
jgi:hypothetical protein